MTDRDLVIKLAWKMWGKPYIWGGDDPMQGFDCSGMVVELLKSVGKLPREGDWTANDLYRMFRYSIILVPHAGCLVFWGTMQKATHIEMMIDDLRTIGASGGGSRTITAYDAIQQNAYIKIRPLEGRSSPFAIVDPFRDEADE